jgi:hypothetical protein
MMMLEIMNTRGVLCLNILEIQYAHHSLLLSIKNDKKTNKTLHISSNSNPNDYRGEFKYFGRVSSFFFHFCISAAVAIG